MSRAGIITLLLIVGSIDGQTLPGAARADAPALARKGPALEDLWDGRAVWVGDGEKIGRDFKFHYLSILGGKDDLWAYYITHATGADGKFKMGVGRARSVDGIKWIDDGPVLKVGCAGRAKGAAPRLWDERMASFPGVWKDGDTWYLVYEGAGEDAGFSPGDIGLATSTDGMTFTKHPDNPILRHEKNGWERANIGTPSLYKEGGVWYLFYHGYDHNVCQIGVASGKRLTGLSKSAANPIVAVSSTAGAWDTGTTGKRSSIVKEGGTYYFAFEGSTPQPYQQSRWSSGLARSKDLTSKWTKASINPMIPRTRSGFGYDGPELLRLGDDWYLYVRSPGNDWSERFRLMAKKGSE